MSVEIERKWFVSTPPEVAGNGTPLRQGYINEDGGTEVRLRAKGDRFLLTVKRGYGMTRTEVEIDLDEEQFEALWPLTAGRRVEKVRHKISHGPYTIELDIFSGSLAPLVVAEVEFSGEDAATSYSPPSWFDVELTGREGWSNGDLARNGLPTGTATAK